MTHQAPACHLPLLTLISQDCPQCSASLLSVLLGFLRLFKPSTPVEHALDLDRSSCLPPATYSVHTKHSLRAGSPDLGLGVFLSMTILSMRFNHPLFPCPVTNSLHILGHPPWTCLENPNRNSMCGILTQTDVLLEGMGPRSGNQGQRKGHLLPGPLEH